MQLLLSSPRLSPAQGVATDGDNRRIVDPIVSGREDGNTWVARGLALLSAAYLLYLVVISIGQAADAEEAGYVVGTVIGVVALAGVMRFIYVRLRSAESRPAFWSPWIAVIAAILMVLSRAISAS